MEETSLLFITISCALRANIYMDYIIMKNIQNQLIAYLALQKW